MIDSVPLYSLVGLSAIGATITATGLVARRLSAPTARFLFGVCLLLSGVALSQMVLLVPSPLRRAIVGRTGVQLPGEYWIATALALTLPAAALWLLFAVGYTGRGDRLRRQVAVGVASLVGIFYVIPVYVVTQTDTGDPAIVTVVGTLASGLFFLSAVAGLGSLLVFEASLQRNAVPLGEGVTLASGALAFVYAPILGLNTERPVLIPLLLTIGSLCFAVAVTRYPVFETLPVARIAARDRLVEDIQDAIVLVDEQGRVVDLNRSATATFDAAAADAERPELHSIFPEAPDFESLAAASEPRRVRTAGRIIEISGNPVRGAREAVVGYLLVCRDVTRQDRRKRRLRVLTRFLADVITEPAATIARQGTAITDAADDDESAGAADTEAAREIGADDAPSAIATAVRSEAETLKRLVAATRRLERALTDHGTGPTDVVAVLRDVATDRGDADADVELSVEEQASETAAAVDPAVLRAVVTLLVEDWVDRSSGSVQLALRDTDHPGPVVVLSGTPPMTTGTPGGTSTTPVTTTGRQRPGARTETAEEPAVTLSRLALEHADGGVEWADGSRSSIRVRLQPVAPPSEAAESGGGTRDPTASDGEDRPENRGEQG